jgi:hypothetical protein
MKISEQTIDNALHKLSVYPVLAVLAKKHTTASRLDGRACRFIYQNSMSTIDWRQVQEQERVFMHRLGVELGQTGNVIREGQT